MKTLFKVFQLIKFFPYNLIAIISAVLYLSFDFYINDTLTFLPGIVNYPLYFVIPFFFTHTIVPILFGVTTALVIRRLILFKHMSKSAGTASIATFIALLSGACPGCVVGLLPPIMLLFGYGAFTVNALPFYGNELQIISIALFLLSIYYLSKDPICKIK